MSNVSLVWITPESEKLIAYCARVSNPANQDNPSYERLIRYLIEHKHWSPFEMASMCVEIETSRAISAQILRHRSFSFQEFSQRYAAVQSVEPIEIRRQSEKNRQSSTDVFNPVIIPSSFDGYSDITANEIIEEYLSDGQHWYNKLVEAGVSKETARMILPMASSTRLYMSGTLRSWIHYLQLRTQEDTQKEHRDIALQIKDILVSQIPTIASAVLS